MLEDTGSTLQKRVDNLGRLVQEEVDTDRHTWDDSRALGVVADPLWVWAVLVHARLVVKLFGVPVGLDEEPRTKTTIPVLKESMKPPNVGASEEKALVYRSSSLTSIVVSREFGTTKNFQCLDLNRFFLLVFS